MFVGSQETLEIGSVQSSVATAAQFGSVHAPSGPCDDA